MTQKIKRGNEAEEGPKDIESIEDEPKETNDEDLIVATQKFIKVVNDTKQKAVANLKSTEERSANLEKQLDTVKKQLKLSQERVQGLEEEVVGHTLQSGKASTNHEGPYEFTCINTIEYYECCFSKGMLKRREHCMSR
jgi:chaperonin cofactor prefoldin